ncbi:MAG TPA: class I SAM-dependent methyltransferase [Casimicrobiaceae bacterium]|nr:class I SAM-dependent methyltransferase [Casimicrobiaceae bacterium]
MNDLRAYFEANPGRMIHKWLHYFEIYERHLARYRGTDAVLLEIGVYQGGSLQMWKHYLGDRATIWGADVKRRCRNFEEERIHIRIGDQSDAGFLASLAAEIPRIDVLIDDGGHTMRQQRTTFDVMFPKVAEDGIYICEDLHTSYWPEYGGGYPGADSFLEYTKSLVDRLNAWHSKDPAALAVSDFTRSAYALHYYDSILVIEKRRRDRPEDRRTGRSTIPDRAFPTPKP